MANDFLLSYWQQAKKEISDDISADLADIKNGKKKEKKEHHDGLTNE